MTVEFALLDALDISERTVEYTIPMGKRTELVLDVRFAGKDNVDYWNAFMTAGTDLDKKTSELLKRAGKDSAGVMAEVFKEIQRINDERAPDLFGKHILRGWRVRVFDDSGDVVQEKPLTDRNGTPVDWSPEASVSFCKQLATHVFSQLRSFCENPKNYVEEIDAEATAKNS